MSSTLLLLDLLGSAALLLWGLRLLKSGMTAAFGPQLRHFLASSTRNRFTALGAGLITTLALQSSTAMAVMTASFVSQGLVAPAMAQAVMLGANVGTAIVTQILSFDLHWLAPLCILCGVFAASRPARRSKGLGDVAIGLGLMLLSLRLMGEATEPMRQSEAVAAFFALLDSAPVVAIALSAGLAAISASSLAVVLFIMSLASAGSIGPELCLLLVAGANLGGALPPVFATMSEGVAARRLAVSNLTVRGIGTVLLLAILGWIGPLVDGQHDLARLTVLAHMGFNLALAVIFLPLIDPLTRLLARLLPDRPDASDNGPRHLDDTVLGEPAAALAAATRETLRVGDLVEKMLDASLVALKTNDELLCRSVFHLDDQVDRLQEAIKLYLARINVDGMNEATSKQSHAILDYAINLEHVGDIIEKSLSQLTLKKINRQLQYSPEGLAEIEDLFADTIDNLQLAQHVFLTREADMARRLMETKPAIRRKERNSLEHHMRRLQQRHPDSLQTTSMHMDVLRDLKRINGHLVSVATPILEEAGQLRTSRLKSR
jgi:phosphate:Na+ symporter